MVELEVAQKAGDSSTVIQTGHRREAEAMETQWYGEEDRVKGKGKIK